MRNPPTIRDVCGTLAGYWRHRRANERRCQPCLDASAKRRRELYVPGSQKESNDKWKKDNREKWKDSSRLSRNKRRMSAKANGQEPYTRMSILERDDYTCYLCGNKVDLEATSLIGNPGWELYPHLDHVIPLSKGGSDKPDNVRTTHAICNMRKKDNPVNEISATVL